MASDQAAMAADGVDEITPSAPRRFLIDVEETLRIVLEQEDTDKK